MSQNGESSSLNPERLLFRRALLSVSLLIPPSGAGGESPQRFIVVDRDDNECHFPGGVS